MTQTEEKITFEQMPQLLAELKGAITGINDKLDALLENGSTPSDTWMDLDAFRAYHPDKLALLPGLNIRVSDFLEKNAMPQQREAHIDIADRLIEEIFNPVPQPVLQPEPRIQRPQVFQRRIPGQRPRIHRRTAHDVLDNHGNNNRHVPFPYNLIKGRVQE